MSFVTCIWDVRVWNLWRYSDFRDGDFRFSYSLQIDVGRVPVIRPRPLFFCHISSHHAFTVLWVYGFFQKSGSHFLKSWWHEVSFVLRTQNSGVSREPHCYLALYARYVWIDIYIFLRVRKETAVIMLKMSDATVQNSGARSLCTTPCHERCIMWSVEALVSSLSASCFSHFLFCVFRLMWGTSLHVCTVLHWRLKHFIVQQMHKYIIRRYY